MVRIQGNRYFSSKGSNHFTVACLFTVTESVLDCFRPVYVLVVFCVFIFVVLLSSYESQNV